MKVTEFFIKYEVTVSHNGRTETVGVTPKVTLDLTDQFQKCRDTVFNSIKQFVDSKVQTDILDKIKDELETKSPTITEKYDIEIIEDKKEDVKQPQIQKEIPKEEVKQPKKKSIFTDF